MDLCPCCGKELPFQGSQVCKYCLDDARKDIKEMQSITIDDLKRRNKMMKKQIFENELAIKLLEKARC